MNKCCFLYARERITTYAACFIGKSVRELVSDFNADVGGSPFSPDRAYYHEALLLAFEERGVDVSAISDGETIDFEHLVEYDAVARALVKIASEEKK